MIRNFIYSDSQKIRSISSQIFEGVTEQAILSKSESKSQKEEQKGPVASGRLLGDIFSKDHSSSELRFLEDHAYTILESKLIDEELVSQVSSGELDNLHSKSFVKIKSTLMINDLAASSYLISDFNNIGDAFWRVTNEEMVWKPNGKPITSDAEVKKKAAAIGMQFNKKVSDAAASIIKFGYNDLLEATMASNGLLFSAPLKRMFLRENEDMLLHKYSRETQMEFVMLAIVTQRGYISSGSDDIPDVKEADGIKEAMRTVSRHMRTFERFFSAPSSSEIIVDPIAIYSVL